MSKKKRGRPAKKQEEVTTVVVTNEEADTHTNISYRDWIIEGHGSLDDLQALINQLRGVK